MLNLDAFNGVWVVCEANYVTDPAKNSFYRSMIHLNGHVLGERADASGWFVPAFSKKSDAEHCRDKICKKLKLDPDEFKAVHIISLRDLSVMLTEFLELGRFAIRFDDDEPTSVKVLLKEVVKRLV